MGPENSGAGTAHLRDENLIQSFCIARVFGIRKNLYLKILIVAIVATGILGYAYFRIKDLLWGPQIIVESPSSGETVDESLVRIKGVASNIKEITLNGNIIFIDEAGVFDEEILLGYGYNVIELRARDKLGREEVKKIEVVYK